MPVKRYAKIGYKDELDYYVYRKSVEDDKIIIIQSGFPTCDEAEGFLDDFDPLFDDLDQCERDMIKMKI